MGLLDVSIAELAPAIAAVTPQTTVFQISRDGRVPSRNRPPWCDRGTADDGLAARFAELFYALQGH